jgi:glutaminyl-tRNA synthetase
MQPQPVLHFWVEELTAKQHFLKDAPLVHTQAVALFLDAQPDAGGKDFIESMNPNSLKVVTAIVEPSLANAQPDQKFQFERHGYFVADRVDHVQGSEPVFNLAVGLKDSWGK